MTPVTIESIRARYESGYSATRIANELRLKRSEVQRMITRYCKPVKSPTANAARKRLDEARKAIAELRAEGYSAELIAANFGT